MHVEITRFTEKYLVVDLSKFEGDEQIGIYIDAYGRVHVCDANGMSLVFEDGKFCDGNGLSAVFDHGTLVYEDGKFRLKGEVSNHG